MWKKGIIAVKNQGPVYTSRDKTTTERIGQLRQESKGRDREIKAKYVGNGF